MNAVSLTPSQFLCVRTILLAFFSSVVTSLKFLITKCYSWYVFPTIWWHFVCNVIKQSELNTSIIVCRPIQTCHRNCSWFLSGYTTMKDMVRVDAPNKKELRKSSKHQLRKPSHEVKCRRLIKIKRVYSKNWCDLELEVLVAISLHIVHTKFVATEIERLDGWRWGGGGVTWGGKSVGSRSRPSSQKWTNFMRSCEVAQLLSRRAHAFRKHTSTALSGTKWWEVVASSRVTLHLLQIVCILTKWFMLKQKRVCKTTRTWTFGSWFTPWIGWPLQTTLLQP